MVLAVGQCSRGGVDRLASRDICGIGNSFVIAVGRKILRRHNGQGDACGREVAAAADRFRRNPFPTTCSLRPFGACSNANALPNTPTALEASAGIWPGALASGASPDGFPEETAGCDRRGSDHFGPIFATAIAFTE